MIKTLRESKATLSALVDQASRGEEIIITVHGKPKARLCPIEPVPHEEIQSAWASRVREDWAKYSTHTTDSSEEILEKMREDRL
jgi:prevent-host-death family protein